ncbi:hypothetical protein P3777_20715 [Pseudomonas aeruginosa]|nr:hypothetical protein [Pseudomonas aeruginosa]
MLEQSLLELTIASLLSSQSLVDQLRADLLSPQAAERFGEFDKRHKAYLQRLAHEIDQRHHGRFRLNDLTSAAAHAWPATLLRTPDIKPLDALFDELFLCNGDYVHYRPERLREYASLCSKLDPSVVVAWHLAKQFKKSAGLHAVDIYRIVQAQQPLFSPPPISNKPFAEGHVHLGGIHFDGIILMNQLAGEPGMEDFAPLHRLTHALLSEWPPREGVGNAQQIHILNLCRRALGDQHMTNPVTILDWSSLAHLQASEDDIRKPNWLKRQIALAVTLGDLDKAWLWLLVWLWTQYQSDTAPAMLRMSIFFLISALMSKRRQLIMDGQGLSRFSGIYGKFASASGSKSHTPKPRSAFAQGSVRKLFQGAADVAEIKISEQVFNPDSVRGWALAINRHHGQDSVPLLKQVNANQAARFKAQMERWHFCVHFLRRTEHLKNRNQLWLEGENLFQKLTQQTGWSDPTFLDGYLSPHFHFEPDAWVRGLDVAGDENKTRNEIYAPMLRWLRSGLQPNVRKVGVHNGFHLSIHAGEDYAHPLSGMRHIDETVRFCEMRHGDRIGHALALGVSPRTWCENQGDMLLPVDEHLDNLVWLWHNATLLAPRLPLANKVLPRLERRITQFAAQIPWIGTNYLNAFYPDQHKKTPATTPTARFISPQTLHDAWRLRRNCFHMLEGYRSNRMKDAKVLSAVPDLTLLSTIDFDRLNGSHADPTPELLYWRRSTHIKHGSSKPLTVRVSVRPHATTDYLLPRHDAHLQLLQDYETEDDLELMEALQDWLIDEYDQRGVIFETNPSSNVYIARIRRYEDHPIFRWNPPDESVLEQGARHNRFGLRRGPIRVTVNTDDPGVIPTTLRTEYALLLEASCALGISRTCAEEWLERLRVYANDQFHRTHQQVFRDR